MNSNQDDLSFDPNERVVLANMESHRAPERPNRPPQSQAATPPQSSGNQNRPIVRPPDPTRRVVKQPQQDPRQAQRAEIRKPAQSEQPAAPAARKPHVEIHVQKAATPTPATKPIPVSEPTASTPVPIPERTQRPLDSRFEDIDLPSAFEPYEFKQLAIRRFTVEELRSIVRARVSGNLRHLVRALDNTISESVYDLTVGDFWFLMYWHRINSYKKTPFIITWTCDHAAHLERVQKQQVEPKSLQNLTTIGRGNLTTLEINVQRYREVAERILTEHGLRIQAQTLTDFLADQDELELIERRREKAKLDLVKEQEQNGGEEDEVATFLRALDDVSEDEERNFVNRYATVLHIEHGRTLQDRVALLGTLETDVLTDLEEFLEVSDHGVIEKFHVKCQECGASRVIEQSLDALSFLPSLQRGGHS